MAGGAGRIGRGGRRAESAAVRRAESTAVRLAESAAEWRAEFTGHPELPEICPAGPLKFSNPDIARSTGKDGTAQASYRKTGHRSISMAGFTDSGLRGGFCHSAGTTPMADPPPLSKQICQSGF